MTAERQTGPEPPVVLFDGVCNLCSGAVRFILKRDVEETFRFASLQSSFGQELLSRYGHPTGDLQTMALVENGRVFTRSTAALRVARRLRAPWRYLYALGLCPRPLRDLVYRIVARYRYRWFGRQEQCLVPTPALRDRFLG